VMNIRLMSRELYLSLDKLKYINDKNINDNFEKIKDYLREAFEDFTPKSEPYERTVPVGTMINYAIETPPTGYLLCDGKTYDNNVYKNLFNVIGYTFGREENKFKVPNYTETVLTSTITEWVSFTPTITWIANTTATGYWRRIGDTVDFRIYVTTSGAPTATSLYMTLPFSWTINTSKIPILSLGFSGGGIARDNGSRDVLASALYLDSTRIMFVADENTASGFATITQAFPWAWANLDSANFYFNVPITQLALSSDTRTITPTGYYMIKY